MPITDELIVNYEVIQANTFYPDSAQDTWTEFTVVCRPKDGRSEFSIRFDTNGNFLEATSSNGKILPLECMLDAIRWCLAYVDTLE